MSTLRHSPHHFCWVGRKHLMSSSQIAFAKEYQLFGSDLDVPFSWGACLSQPPHCSSYSTND